MLEVFCSIWDLKAFSRLHSALWFSEYFLRAVPFKSKPGSLAALCAWCAVWSQWWAPVLIGVRGKHCGMKISGWPRGGYGACFLPRKLGTFCLEIYCRMGVTGLLSGCTFEVARVWLRLGMLLPVCRFIEGKVCGGGSGWKTRGYDAQVESARIWLERSQQLSFLSVDTANDALQRQSLPLTSN